MLAIRLLKLWRESEPEAPEGAWYKDFGSFKAGEFWKYRVGDYRLVSKIEEDRLLVLVLRIGHRREIYR